MQVVPKKLLADLARSRFAKLHAPHGTERTCVETGAHTMDKNGGATNACFGTLANMEETHKRGRDDGEAGAVADAKVPKIAKPKPHEYVGSDPAGALLSDMHTIDTALVHLKKVDSRLAPLIEQVTAEQLTVPPPPPNHADFVFLSEFIVRRRINVKAANTILGKLKAMTGGAWTPESVIQHAAQLTSYLSSGDSSKKVETILELARRHIDGEYANLASLTDTALIGSSIKDVKGVGDVALRTLLVRMARPDVLVAGDGLVNAWLNKEHGISKEKTDAATERARLDATEHWRPWRSVGYLLINAAKGATLESKLA